MTAAGCLGRPRPRRILLVDAYDSFVYIVAQYLRSAGAEPIVARPDELRPGWVIAIQPEMIVLGPGPGHPLESAHVGIVRTLADRLPIFGICLGHQAIAVAFGATVLPARRLMHGKTSAIMHDGRGVFTGQPYPFRATRYHSLIVLDKTIPPCLEVTARSADDGYVMGLRHRELPIESVQFHPESIRTEEGMRLIRNLVAGRIGLSGASTPRRGAGSSRRGASSPRRLAGPAR